MTLPRRPNEALRHVMAACYRLAPGGTVVSRVLVHVRKAPQTRRSRCRSDVGLRKFRRVRKNYPRTFIESAAPTRSRLIWAVREMNSRETRHNPIVKEVAVGSLYKTSERFGVEEPVPASQA